MNASGSPCPLDKISIIPFKRCPYHRSYITEVIRLIWISGNIPDEWKKACTVLMHKKGDTSEPSNFRPITLEIVPLKIFPFNLRDSMFSFLTSNGYIEHNIQKGFLPKLTGTFEHTAQMSNIINKARVKQRSLVIKLLPYLLLRIKPHSQRWEKTFFKAIATALALLTSAVIHSLSIYRTPCLLNLDLQQAPFLLYIGFSLQTMQL